MQRCLCVGGGCLSPEDCIVEGQFDLDTCVVSWFLAQLTGAYTGSASTES